MYKILLSYLFVFCVSDVLYSQVDMTELDRKYTPISSGNKQPGGTSHVSSMHNGISFELMGLTRGQLSFEYQREILVPNVVGMVSVGIPVIHDFVHRFYGTEWAAFAPSSNQLGYNEYYTSGATSQSAPWFQAGLRILFDDPEDLDGRGIEVRYRIQNETLNFSRASNDLYDFSALKSDLKMKHRSLFISYRSQASNTPRSLFIHGLSYGLGFRMIDYPTVKLEQDLFSFSSTTIAKLDGGRSNLLLISVLLTYTVGFGW